MLRLPHELLRKNFKASQRAVEREREHVVAALGATANTALAAGQGQAQGLQQQQQHQQQQQQQQQPPLAETVVASLDGMLARMHGLKRKLEALHEDEKVLHQHARKRIQHLQDLYRIPSLADVRYDAWSRVRVNRLLVDYLLRSGYGESARALAREKDIEALVDTDVFLNCNRIQAALKQMRTAECLAWCAENKQALKKMNVRKGTLFYTPPHLPSSAHLSFFLFFLSYFSPLFLLFFRYFS